MSSGRALKQPRERLRRLGEDIARQQDEGGPQLDEDRGLNRFRAEVDEQTVRGSKTTSPGRWVAASVVAVAAAVMLFLFWPRSALTFAVDGGSAIALSQWVDSDEETTLRFSDGTHVSAIRGSRWRVSATSAVGATVQLERGELTADVQSRESSRWLVDAGPFSIRVTGTRFATSWNPVTEVFELQMHEGRVVLAGPIVGGQREVRAPEHLKIDVGRQKLIVVSSQSEAPASSGSVRPTPSAEAPSAVASATAVASVSSVAPASSATPTPAASVLDPATPSWAALARRGKHTEALAVVHRGNVAAILGSESSGGLLLLAQTARLAGDHGLASQALSSLATRFPDSVEAKTAQFLAGKLHFDQGRYEQAVTSLSSYLASPGGAFAGEANVLLIVALHRAGRVDQARGLAQKYLDAHPDGPHAARLRSIVAP